MRNLAYKRRLYPNQEQKVWFARSIGAARWVYNHFLEKHKLFCDNDEEIMETYKRKDFRKNTYAYMKELVELKKNPKYKWLKDINSQTLQDVIWNLDSALVNHEEGRSEFPVFKCKHNDKKRFTVVQKVKYDNIYHKLYIPKFRDGIKSAKDSPITGNIKKATISKSATRKYFVSIVVEDGAVAPSLPMIDVSRTIGIDLNTKDFIVLSDGRKFANPKILKIYAKRINRKNKQLSRCKKGSNGYYKKQLELAKLHEKVKNTRYDFLHKLSSLLVHDNQVDTYVLEDLNISGMMRNHNLAGVISDCGWGTFVRMMEYKCAWYGKNFVKISRWAPSSKTCSHCGCINDDLKLSDRVWSCPSCGVELDRDINAAINIKSFGLLKLEQIPVDSGEFKRGKTAGSKRRRRSPSLSSEKFLEPPRL